MLEAHYWASLLQLLYLKGSQKRDVSAQNAQIMPRSKDQEHS
jgi:hypothetical protein